ncbi:MAG TPA: AI-2E family transporter [Atopostipes sp.]|nr:AI-2E family transporter [Atopostipes sp.]
MSSNRDLFKRLFIRIIITVLIILTVVFGIPVIFKYLFPFILAFAIAAFLNPLINFINKGLSKIKIISSVSRGMITLLITILILLVLGYGLYTIVMTLLQEIFGLANTIQNNWGTIVKVFENTERWLTFQIKILPPEAIEIVEGVIDNILVFLRNFTGNLLNYTVAISGILISKGGSLTLNLVTFFLSLYFIMSDYDRIKTRVKSQVHPNILKTIRLLRNTIVLGVGGYVKTQFLLSFTAFVVMFIAFSVYGVDYALTISFVLAIVDIIPLIGTIAVLLPWGIYELIFGITNFGFFLVLLGIGFFIFRRLIEPKIMGSQTGLHPLFALIGIYVGIQFSGLWGALLGPLVMVVFIGIIKSGILDNTFADMNEVYHKISATLNKK